MALAPDISAAVAAIWDGAVPAELESETLEFKARAGRCATPSWTLRRQPAALPTLKAEPSLSEFATGDRDLKPSK